MKRCALGLLALLICLGIPNVAEARERVFGWCEQGGQTVNTAGLASTSKVQASFPLCTVTVFDAGTLDVATIFADEAGTPKANPFTADTLGLWFFYADDARYDVELKGGGLPATWTISDIFVNGANVNTGAISVVAFSATPAFDVSDASNLFITLTGNVTSSTITNPLDGQIITIFIEQDGTGGWTFVFPADVRLRSDGNYTIASGPNNISAIELVYDSANAEWQERSRGHDGLLVFDGPNTRLGVGTDTPTATLHTVGDGVIFDSNTDGSFIVDFISGNSLPEPIMLQFGTFGDANIGSLEFSSTATVLRSITDVAIMQANASALFLRPTGNNDCIILEESVGGSDLMTVCDAGTTGDVTVTGDLQVDGFANSITGFQHNSLAPLGNVLRGNGTNFVSATLAAADLSDTATTGNVLRGNGTDFVSAALALGDLAANGTLAGSLTVSTTLTVDGASLLSGTVSADTFTSEGQATGITIQPQVGAASQAGLLVNIIAGASATTTGLTGGTIGIAGGAAGSGSGADGGAISIIPGAGDGAGTDGVILFRDPTDQITARFLFTVDSDTPTMQIGSDVTLQRSATNTLKTADGFIFADTITLAASTTPSIQGGNVFLTNSTASITDFTNEADGQIITIICASGDSTTSLVDSSPLFLAGAFTCSGDDVIQLVSNGTNWYEISRSVN